MSALYYKAPGVEEAYGRYADTLYRIAFGILASKEDSEDAVADVFAKYITAPPVLKDTEHEKAWFIRVTVNRCKDIRRRLVIRSYTPLEEITQLAAEDRKDYQTLAEVLRLPEKYKTVILLYYFEDMSIEAISGVLRLTKSGVKMRLSRARELLKNSGIKGDDYVQ